jgi:hypothetical protein
MLGHRAGVAQELEPGLYQSAPIRLNALFANYTFSTGNILFDPSLPIEGASSDIHTVGLGYLRTFGLFGRFAKTDLAVPISAGDFEGYVSGAYRTRSPSGLADPRLRVAVILIGAPALERQQFAAYRQGIILGASLQVVAPLGQYDPSRLINIGSNRWSFRPEMGLSRTRGRWFLEAAAGAWLYTENAENYGGTTLRQDPLLFVKFDAVYTFKRNTWVAANYGLATGGETRIDDAPPKGLQTNNRVGVNFALPIGRSWICKFVYTSGVTTRLGADYDSYGVGLQYTWGG